MKTLFRKISVGAITGCLLYIICLLISRILVGGIDLTLVIGAQIVLLSSFIGFVLGIIELVIINYFNVERLSIWFEIFLSSILGGVIYYFYWMYPSLSIKDDVYLTIAIVGIVNGILITSLARPLRRIKK